MRKEKKNKQDLDDTRLGKSLLYDLNKEFEGRFESYLIARELIGGGIVVCLQGETEFLLDLKSYKLKKGDMCIVFPFSIFQTISKSDDFERYVIGVDMELIKDIQIPSATEYYLYIKDNPCVSLDEEELIMVLNLLDMMMQKYSIADHPFRREIAKSMFKVIYFELAAIYWKRNPIVHENVPRKDSLVREFMYILALNYDKHREVEYYASKLCVTPRYLSSVVKEKTGSSASHWIDEVVVKQAKNLLRGRNLSVLQISEKLNFANPSFFGQYFKRQTGMTPKRFRDEDI
ncbi:AraC family transcriptional regulator [Bacteroides sp. 224]|uniref:helix-turn-helix domain-containing protein n=1 Tax=Bacteroides sp. 224 TaxID=2302936 RepID=UPI0013D27364|nr:helix-turn-helix domain-containing protein [Bacteroides sp. 224]NDV67193.1 AraC family transcriptional regulator [Bacteroides sp. 224]